MSCRKNYWETSCRKNPNCVWQEDALTAKRHMVFHAFNVLSHASVGFSSRGVCREASPEEKHRAAEEALQRRRVALEEANRAAEEAVAQSQEAMRALHRRLSDNEERHRQRQKALLARMKKK